MNTNMLPLTMIEAASPNTFETRNAINRGLAQRAAREEHLYLADIAQHQGATRTPVLGGIRRVVGNALISIGSMISDERAA